MCIRDRSAGPFFAIIFGHIFTKDKVNNYKLFGSIIGFLSIAAANLINDFTQNSYIGYLAVGGFYLLIFVGLYRYSKTGKLKERIESEFLKGLK